MKAFFYEIDQRIIKKYNLFDILFTILKNKRYLSGLNEESSNNLNRHNTSDYYWVRYNDKKYIEKGDLNEEYTTDDGNTGYTMVKYEENHHKTFSLLFRKDDKPIYQIILNIIPTFIKTIYVREFSRFFDKEDVSWNNVDLSNYIPEKIGSDKKWFKIENMKYEEKESVIKYPSSKKDGGVWYYGLFNNDTFEEYLKINVEITPKIMEIINNTNKEYTIEGIFNKNMINPVIDLNCHNKLTWTSYTNTIYSSSTFRMIDYFEKQIVYPLTIEYFDNYLSLFRAFMSYTDIPEKITLDIRNGVHYIRENWIDESKYIKDEMKKIYIDKPFDALREIYKLFDSWTTQGHIIKDFSDFLKNEFFSYKKANILDENDWSKPLEEGTYLLRFVNNKQLNETTNYSIKARDIIHIPSYKDKLLAEPQYPLFYNSVYLAVFVIYYIKQKPKTKKEIVELESENVNFTIMLDGKYKNVEYDELPDTGEIYTYIKTPNIKTNFNDRFFGYYIKSI